MVNMTSEGGKVMVSKRERASLAILGVGQPLLDISCRVSQDFLDLHGVTEIELLFRTRFSMDIISQ
jgi:hypothetical protein